MGKLWRKKKRIHKALEGKRWMNDEVSIIALSPYFRVSNTIIFFGFPDGHDCSVSLCGDYLLRPSNMDDELITTMEVLAIVRGVSIREDMIHREKRTGR